MVCGKSSSYSMIDFYKVMEWIPRSRVDRQEPCDLDSIIFEDDAIVIPTVYEEFDGVDEVQFFINFNGSDVDVSSITLDFSPFVEGIVSLLQAKCTVNDIDYDKPTVIQFKLDNNTRFTDQSRIITGIKSLKLTFGEPISNIEISKIIMRCHNYTYTLSDIEKALTTGENHVRSKLGHISYHRPIPKQLQDYVYMAGGAYAWLTRWEYETKPMKEPKSESNNYADRLLGQVDKAIEKFLMDIETKKDHIDLYHARYSSIEWGL